jgi:MinD-like ATPase involved in chromosome partitioning or flagellar assembly
MTKIISIHSFRGGTGKTTISTNVAVLLAKSGLRVGILDSDIQSPGAHILFGLTCNEIGKALNHFLWGECKIEDTAYEITDKLGDTAEGKLFIIPSSIQASDIARILRDGYDEKKIQDALTQIGQTLELDILIVDTHPGFNDTNLLIVALSDTLGVLLRPDQQDYQGTSVTMQVARKLEVPEIELVVNKSPSLFNPEMVKTKVEEAYDASVAALLQHSDEVMALAGNGIFALENPNDPFTEQLKQTAVALAK